jgi:hypothetical protein
MAMEYKRLTFLAASLLLAAGSCTNRTLRLFPTRDSELSSAKAGAIVKSCVDTDALIVDANFPGGNIIVDDIKSDTVYLRPDQRDSSKWWFYWYFRVRGAAGCTIKFQFTDKDPIGTQGPAFSTDGGHTWSWLGRDAVKASSFTYEFDRQSREVQFCFSIPYLEANLYQFLGKYSDNTYLTIRELCRTRKGRSVERLHTGKINGEPKYRVLLTARHHACEMIASYALEGFLETILSDTDVGRWFQNNVEVLAVPFMDKDGVEDGDQGKHRSPHDHNRDYISDSIYPSVQAMKEFVPQWSEGKLKVALDLHCPSLRGRHNEVIYIVGNSDPAIWRQQQEFAAILESVREGLLPYSAESSLAFGSGWNTGANYGKYKSYSRWGGEQPGVSLASTIEIPYANAGTTTVTTDNARAFGRDLAIALRRYLENSTE